MENNMKITLNLGIEAQEAIREIQTYYGNITLAEAFRKSIGTEKYIIKLMESNHSIIIEDNKTKDQRILVLR